MDKKDILKKKIKQIEIKSNRLVNSGLAGKYHSTFKGRGMEFDSVREYQYGDDIRNIDWNVTAKHQKPYIKVFTEEREMTVIFLIDMSASLSFGSIDQTKMSLAAEIVSVLAFSAIKNNDRVGMLSFTDKIEQILRPKKGKNNILRMIRELLYFKPQGTKTSISVGLKAINEIWQRKAVVFLVSDFQDSGYEKDLKLTAQRHDLICVNISDPKEKGIPRIGLIDFYDPEKGKVFTIDSSDKRMITDYYGKIQYIDQQRKKMFSKSSVDVINIMTGSVYMPQLTKFFANRQRKTVLG
jgi:uncharacterized protein (DUF58 family)